MFGGREFRIAIFGGYNKEDVHEYLETLEKESEMEIFGYQNKISELNEENKKLQEDKNSLENIIQQYKTKIDDAGSEKVKDNSAEIEKYIAELKNQMRENEKLRQEIAGLEADKYLLIENKKRAEMMLEELKANEIQKNDNQLEDEIQQLKEKKEKYDDDFQAITKVLEDARLSARHIEEQAQKKSEEMLAKAKEECEEILKFRKTKIDKELEDKGIRLVAAKYKIEAYRKEINSTQQKLYNLYSDMGKLVDGMPQCLEQLWDEEGYIGISENQKIKEENEGKNSESETTD